MSLLFVFLILAAMYENWSLPFSVLFLHPWQFWEPAAGYCCAGTLWTQRSKVPDFDCGQS